MTKIIRNWEDLKGLESDHYKIVVEEDGHSGWIYPKEETEETSGKNWLKHHKYLSTHTFYKEGNAYQHSTKLLREYGFDVNVIGY